MLAKVVPSFSAVIWKLDQFLTHNPKGYNSSDLQAHSQSL
jgi:hypothetical protein